MNGMESTQCYLCQGDTNPNPYGESTTKTLVGFIDVTPTWEEVAAMCILILSASESSTALNIAKEEIFKMARLADAYVAEHKKGK
jgi:hypothetical protein